MVKLKAIQKHNKNINEAREYLNNYKWYDKSSDYISETTNDYNQYGIINNTLKFFNAKNNIISGYNKLVDNHNIIARSINEINGEINYYLSLSNKLNEITNKLNKQKDKMLYLCQNVYKPENYDYCVYLMHEKWKAEEKTNATKTISRGGHSKNERNNSHSTDYESHTTFINGVASTTTSSTFDPVYNSSNKFGSDDDYETVPDEELIEEGQNKLNEINNEIDKQGNYEYNMNLRNLYWDYDHLVNVISSIPEYINKEHERIQFLEKRKNNLLTALTKIDDYIKNENEILNECDISTNNAKISEKELIKDREKKISDNFIPHIMHKIHNVNGYDFSILQWTKKCNEYIQMFEVKDIKSDDISKMKEDEDYDYNDLGYCM